MSQYLIFQLHGPMASWGVDAPGEVRHTHELPSRSALLGRRCPRRSASYP
ncbi:CRISPR-associated protein Cas5 [Escherichia coli]|nr:CRISPR-associated protein Cas5 [Escherichia coli]